MCAEYEMWHDGRLTSFAGGTPSPGLMVEVKSRAGRGVLSDSVACFPPGEANPVICNRGGGVSL